MSWKNLEPLWRKQVIAVILFLILYTVTIPVRDYEFLNRFIDTTQGVPIWVHLIIIVVGAIVLLILLTIIEIIIKYKKK